MTAHERFRLPDRDSLLARAERLGVEIPWSDDVSVLLESIEIAGRILPNRLVVQPMEGCDGETDGSPGEKTYRRYRRFGSGGAGLIWFEATAVRMDARANPQQLCLLPETVDRFRDLVAQTRKVVRDSGGHDTLFLLQLTHSGRYTKTGSGPVFACHSPPLDKAMGIDSDYPLISDDELDRLQNDYLVAARLARDAGFDGVDVKSCHGYLLSELLAARTRENSRYGGSFENRSRFLREVIERIRNELPDLVVTSRFNAWDGIPHPHGFGADAALKENLEEPERLIRALRSLGCPLLNVSMANPYFNPHFSRPFDVPMLGREVFEEHPLAAVARMLRIAARLQRAVPDLPLVGTGYSWLRQHFPHVGAGAIRAGGVTLVGVGRMAFAYPRFARDLMDHGRLDPKASCITCSRCSQIMRDGGETGCVVRDSELYLPEFRAGRKKV